jgi:hypothetical protein
VEESSARITVYWNPAAKHWNVLGSLGGKHAEVSAAVITGVARTTVELDRAALGALVAAVVSELESRLL